MSVDSVVDDAFTMLLQKAQQRIPDPPVLPAVITINFDGNGSPLVVGQGGVIEVTFPCRILGCHLYSGIEMVSTGPQPLACSASVYLGLGAQGSWSTGSRPLYSNLMPSITAAAEANVSIDGWVLDLNPGDLIAYGLVAFSGSATFLSLTLPVRRLDLLGTGIFGVLSQQDQVIDSNSNTVISRGN